MGSIDNKPKYELESRHFINGEFVASISGKKFDVLNPATEKVSSSFHEAGAEDVDVAVEAAKAAFPAWSELPASERGRYLYKLADAVDRAGDEINYADAITMGRPIGSMPANGDMLRYFAGRAMDVQGESSLNTPGYVNMTFRQPFGVCGAIIPWNGSLTVLCLKLGPALVAGNTLVVKSSEKAPPVPLIIARLAKEIGLPKGVLNVLSGFGTPCGEAIAKHMDIRKLSFTGSTLTGRKIKKMAAESNLKKVSLELGGKSPLIVFPDADLERAIPGAAFSILFNSGQICIASSRVYVHKDIASQFIDKLKETFNALGVSGDPTSTDSKRGPQADKIQYDRVKSYLQAAKDQNLDVVLGGSDEGKAGFFIQPTIIRNVPDDSNIIKEEIFGPVVCVQEFEDETEVIRRANDTDYGLYASVYTQDISRAMRVAKAFESGTVGVNCTSPSMALDMPFGGYKASGEGRELSKHGLDHWTEIKTVLIAL